MPPGATELFRRVVGAWGNEDLIENAFAMREYDPGDELAVGPLTHPLPARPALRRDATRSRSPPPTAAARITYGADHAPTDALVDFARDTDLLLIEATLPRPEREGPRGHITPGEAGEHAPQGRRAPRRADPLLRRARARTGRARRPRRAFGGPVEMAHEGAVYDV